MFEIYLVLYILAAACFFAFAIGFESKWIKLNLLGLGVFFWSLVPLIQTIHKL